MATKRKSSTATATSAPANKRARPQKQVSASLRKKRKQPKKIQLKLTIGGRVAVPTSSLLPPADPSQPLANSKKDIPVPRLANEILERILEFCDPITRISLALSHKELFFALDNQKKWYHAQVPIPMNMYLTSSEHGGGGRSLSLRVLLKDYMQPGHGENGPVVLWDAYAEEYQYPKRAGEIEYEVEEYITDILDYREERQEARERRVKKKAKWDKMFLRERAITMELMRAGKRQELDDTRKEGEDPAEDGASELDEDELEVLEEDVLSRYPEPEDDTDSEDDEY